MSNSLTIDKERLDLITKKLKNLIHPIDIMNWIENFKSNEIEMAVDLLMNYTIYTSFEIEEIFNHELNSIREKTPNGVKIAIHPIGAFGKSGSIMAYLLNKTNTVKNYSKKIKLCSNIEQLKSLNSNFKTLILIDDFVGSGGSIDKYWKNSIIPNDINSNFDKILFLGIAGMDFGIKKIAPLFNEVIIPKSNKFKKAFSSNASYFGIKQSNVYRELVYGYGKKLSTPKTLKNGKLKHFDALGFSNSQGMIGFFYGSPNNSLPIFWQERRGELNWNSLLPRFSDHKITKAKQFRKNIALELSVLNEFKSISLVNSLFLINDYKKPHNYSSFNHINFTLYAIIKMMRMRYSEFSICLRLGILYKDFSEYIELGKKNGLFSTQNTLTTKGLQIYIEAKSCIKKSKKIHFEKKNDYSNNNILYIPKKFNGRT